MFALHMACNRERFLSKRIRFVRMDGRMCCADVFGRMLRRCFWANVCEFHFAHGTNEMSQWENAESASGILSFADHWPKSSSSTKDTEEKFKAMENGRADSRCLLINRDIGDLRMIFLHICYGSLLQCTSNFTLVFVDFVLPPRKWREMVLNISQCNWPNDI